MHVFMQLINHYTDFYRYVNSLINLNLFQKSLANLLTTWYISYVGYENE
jgi:hypothetical protein